jgi:glycosyltransferase involved in cell wall biosynthesis
LAWRYLKKAKFENEVILTVANGWGWKTAHRIARKNRLPLHLVIHDDYAWQPFHGSTMSQMREWDFIKCLRYCEKVYVVSESMREEYYSRYGVECTVLYPMMEASPISAKRTEFSEYGSGDFSIYHAGTLYEETIVGLGQLASRISNTTVKFKIVGANKTSFEKLNGSGNKFEYCGIFARPKDAMQLLVEDAKILILIQPRSNNPRIAHSFPSKFSDYTALSKPIICIADSDSPISKFMVAEGLKEFLFDFDYDSAAKKLLELFDCENRYSNACAVFEDVGRRCFSEHAIMSKFRL